MRGRLRQGWGHKTPRVYSWPRQVPVTCHAAGGVRARMVYAIDHSGFIAVATHIADHNGIRNITFVQKNSRDFVCPEPADLIIHEQMGHTIFEENMIQNLLDLKRRALKPGGRILPGRFELVATPVALKDEYLKPFLWQMDVPGFDVAFLEKHECLTQYRTQEHRQRLLKGFEVESFLAPSRSLLSFDLNDITSESELAVTHDVCWDIDTDGTVDGICFHFRTRFDDGTTFDTSPFNRQTNWENALIRTTRIPVVAGDALSHTIRVDPLTNWSRWQVLNHATASRA